MKSLISVVVPALNEETLIGRCLDSLQRQDYAGQFEVIVVDNGSTDRTAQIAAAKGAKVVSEPRRGVCMARQAGTEVAKGEIVVSTDADTIFKEDWLSRIAAAFEDQGVVGVAGTCEFVDSPMWGKYLFKCVFGLTSVLYKITGETYNCLAVNLAFKRSAWSGYNTNITQRGDELALLSDLRKKGKFVFASDLKVFTSSRRLHKGIFYNFFVTLLAYYTFDYLFGRVTGKSLLKYYPAVR